MNFTSDICGNTHLVIYSESKKLEIFAQLEHVVTTLSEKSFSEITFM